MTTESTTSPHETDQATNDDDPQNDIPCCMKCEDCECGRDTPFLVFAATHHDRPKTAYMSIPAQHVEGYISLVCMRLFEMEAMREVDKIEFIGLDDEDDLVIAGKAYRQNEPLGKDGVKSPEALADLVRRVAEEIEAEEKRQSNEKSD